MFGCRPTATSSSSPLAVEPSSSVDRHVAVAGDRDGATVRAHVDARLAQRRLDLLGGERLLARRSRAARPRASDDLRPERRPRLRELDADDAAAEDHEALRAPPSPSSPRGSPTAATSARPGIGGIDGPLPVATMTALRGDEHVVADRDAPLAVEPRVAAHELDAALLEPRQLARVVEVVDHLVAPREHGRRRRARRSRTPGTRSSRPAARRAAAAPSTACTRSRSTRRRRGAARRARPTSPLWPSRPAATSPAGPAPITTTSKLRSAIAPSVADARCATIAA